MKKLVALIFCLWTGIIISANADDSFSIDQTFGGEVPAAGEAVTLKQAIANLEQGEEGFVKIKGQVTEVCQAKGCWMILVDGDTYARVTFEDYGFFVPIETSMQRSVIYGQLSEHVLSGAQAEHFAQDAGAQSTLKLEGEVREYSILARAVQLEDRS
ncbi:MAG: DUF4920 domain-containing protein [Gammaproteobacteria bacterium]|nr:DUF4920 domain-containing protein [Gammaproteobacteria bacterium]MDD9894826.1 DUF4920 domain-containing protein [Gammaproteobacteria bacterium]MDD9960087.1 DUF4920 domain-containing protein [Gammaproteobacteria bacterium]